MTDLKGLYEEIEEITKVYNKSSKKWKLLGIIADFYEDKGEEEKSKETKLIIESRRFPKFYHKSFGSVIKDAPNKEDNWTWYNYRNKPVEDDEHHLDDRTFDLLREPNFQLGNYKEYYKEYYSLQKAMEALIDVYVELGIVTQKETENVQGQERD